MTLNWSFDFIYSADRIDAVLSEIAGYVSERDRARLLGALPWRQQESLTCITSDGNRIVEIRRGIARAENDCYSFAFEDHLDLVEFYSDHFPPGHPAPTD